MDSPLSRRTQIGKGVCTLLTLSAALIIVGCAEAPVAKQTAPAVVEIPTALPGLSASERLRRSLELLEDGDEVTARVELVAYMREAKNSPTGRSLLSQIDTPSEEYFPAEFREVILRKDQSLSNIAKTYLGSAVQFHALAKYNAIERPKRMFPGQIVKVPLTDQAVSAFAELEDALDEPALDSLPLAERIDAPPIDTDVSPAANAAATAVADAVVVPGDTKPRESAIAVKDEVTEAAETRSIAVQEQDSTQASAKEVLAAPVPLDVDVLHRRAINAYRAQDLDTAIALWDQILGADPSYEGARLYRSQALALRKRLDSLN
ncbi:MAG: tetratricopeptide (TPR) repeat protein [Glaciecola sp.]|jgi:tetratricopeptide (TPR) repeat protein